MRQQQFTFDLPDLNALSYLLYLPPDYESHDSWPLILYLHGAGERGEDLTLLLNQPLPKLLEHDDLPFIVVSPQCPLGMWWTSYTETLVRLLEDVIGYYKVDRRRVYLTGISMGGYGTWQLAMEHPEKFAAIVPICGGWPWTTNITEKVCVLKDMPIWVFHGARDTVVEPQESIAMVDAIRACGGNPRLTIYPDADHDSWTRTYANAALYDWLLSHRKDQVPSANS